MSGGIWHVEVRRSDVMNLKGLMSEEVVEERPKLMQPEVPSSGGAQRASKAVKNNP
jgi:hypothetical protein